MTKFVEKSAPVEAVRFYSGQQPWPDGVKLERALIRWSEGGDHYYIDALRVNERPRMATMWLHKDGDESKVMPFAFWKVKSGLEEPIESSHPLFIAAVRAEGWPEDTKDRAYVLETPVGMRIVNEGDWIVTDSTGRRANVDPGVFAEKYEAVE